MGDANIFLSEFFRQALRQSSCAKLTSSKCTRDSAGRSSGDDQNISLSVRFFDIVVLEHHNGASSKRECSHHINLETILNVLKRGVKEWLPDAVRNIKKRDTDGSDVIIRIRWHDWCSLD